MYVLTGDVWCHYLFTYCRYHFSSCQWEQCKNIPWRGLGLLNICSRNSLQEEVSLTNALIWKRAAGFPPACLAGASAVALVSISVHRLSLNWFLFSFLSPFPAVFPSLSHPSLSCAFCHYLICFNSPQKTETVSPPSLFVRFYSISLSRFLPISPSSFTLPFLIEPTFSLRSFFIHPSCASSPSSVVVVCIRCCSTLGAEK